MEMIKKTLPLFAVLILLQPFHWAEAKHRAIEEKPRNVRAVAIPLDYVRSAGIVENVIFGFPNRTLVVEFSKPMRVISTLEGERSGILFVGNHYTPPPCWNITHEIGFDKCKTQVYQAVGLSGKNTCCLFTGADMRNLSVRTARFGKMAVYALVTAGVRTNAVRTSRDEGRFVEPGTINIIVMTNNRLAPRAMARAIITATEAKTAAVQDLDVRSNSNPRYWQATGTGTDEVMVVEGRGAPVENTGAHSKLGELIAGAVYEAVKDAIYRQNGLMARRSLLQRLRERNIDLQKIIRECPASMGRDAGDRYISALEDILLQPRFASFMESALALSDAYEAGLIASLESFQTWRRKISEEIAENEPVEWSEPITSEELPVVIRMSLNALVNGLFVRERRNE